MLSPSHRQTISTFVYSLQPEPSNQERKREKFIKWKTSSAADRASRRRIRGAESFLLSRLFNASERRWKQTGKSKKIESFDSSTLCCLQKKIRFRLGNNLSAVYVQHGHKFLRLFCPHKSCCFFQYFFLLLNFQRGQLSNFAHKSMQATICCDGKGVRDRENVVKPMKILTNRQAGTQ